MWPSSDRAAGASTVAESVGSSPPSGLGAPAGKLESDILERGKALSAQPVTALLLLIPVATYFWYIHQFGVNAIWFDQWDNIALLTHSSFFLHSYAGHTSVSMLWSQHNENRMLFPNLVVLALGSLTHLNILTEEYLSAVLLVISVSLIVLANRRDLAPVHWIIYLPVAFLMLSVGQFGDTLFAVPIGLVHRPAGPRHGHFSPRFSPGELGCFRCCDRNGRHRELFVLAGIVHLAGRPDRPALEKPVSCVPDYMADVSRRDRGRLLLSL